MPSTSSSSNKRPRTSTTADAAGGGPPAGAVDNKDGGDQVATNFSALLSKCDAALDFAARLVNDARVLSLSAGLSIGGSVQGGGGGGSSCLENDGDGGDGNNSGNTVANNNNNDNNSTTATTGGHSNTNHIVVRTGDEVTDRIAEYKRRMQARAMEANPEGRPRLTESWDVQAKVKGSRRRRLLPSQEAPPCPPNAGYQCLFAQITVKWRHERKEGASTKGDMHDIVREVARVWEQFDEEEKKYYNDLVEQAKEEYEQQKIEYRATGHYQPSAVVEKIRGVKNLWLYKDWHKKNELEKEIASYDTYVFNTRPVVAAAAPSTARTKSSTRNSTLR